MIEMSDELRGWGLPVPVVRADAGYGDKAHFQAALGERDLGYIVQVKGSATAHAAEAVPELLPSRGKGWRGLPRYRTKSVSLREHVLAAGRRLCWRQGLKGELAAEFVALRIRPAGRRRRYDDDGTLAEDRLIAPWPPDEAEPVKHWLSNPPADTPLQDLIRLGKIRRRIEHDHRELKTGQGLDRYEGRAPGPAGTATSPSSPPPACP